MIMTWSPCISYNMTVFSNLPDYFIIIMVQNIPQPNYLPCMTIMTDEILLISIEESRYLPVYYRQHILCYTGGQEVGM